MNTLLKLTLLCVITVMTQIQFVQAMHDTGRGLCILQNLPHRGLGMLYAASVMAPQRKDWAQDYITEWAILEDEVRMIEGARKPVIPFMAIELNKFNPENKGFNSLAGLCKQIEQKRKDDLDGKDQGPKVSVLEGVK